MYENGPEETFRIRKPRQGEILGVVESLMGANKIKVRCQDDKIRLCRIPGKLRKRMWMHEGDVVLIKPWDIQGDKSADIVIKYSPTQASWLRRKGFLTMSI